MHTKKKIQFMVVATYNNIGKYIWKKPMVKTIDETLDYIIDKKCSVSRFGDGEFTVIQGHGNGFQYADEDLGKKLAHVLKSNTENHIVCISDVFGDLGYLKENSYIFHKGLLNTERKAWLSLLKKDKVYYNAFFTRCYNMFRDKSLCGQWFEKIKKVWENEDVLYVEGEKTRGGVGNDLFKNVKSMERILCPAENAYEKYEQILEEILLHGKGKLILLSLGMTATVLAYDLAQKGFWAIDIGHIDIEYEWYLRKAVDKIKIEGKYVNEVIDGRICSDECMDEDYKKQIVCKII